MPLVNCPECEKPISDRATFCPKCGFPLNNNSIELETKRLVDNGQILAAIKYYRERTNCSLKESKDRVDLLKDVNLPRNNRKSGFIILIVILLIIWASSTDLEKTLDLLRQLFSPFINP